MKDGLKRKIERWLRGLWQELEAAFAGAWLAVEEDVKTVLNLIKTVVKWAMIVVIGFLALVGLGVMWGLGAELEPAVVVEPTPTVVVEPTPTNLPSSTPTPSPSPTLTPTSTPGPPTATATTDKAEGEYVVWGVGVGDSFSHGFTEMARLNDELTDDPYVVLDQGWRDKAVAVMTEVKLTAREVINYPPEDVPERFRPAHDELVLGSRDADEAINKYAEFLDALTEGLRNDDVGKVEEATALVEEVTELMQSANNHMRLVNELMPDPPGRGGD